ncbi:MAG TPA: aspartate kinase [Verrucomicrobiae bacterium]|nr:aspartate kinase [Verrucomicrobiae bacterium]
MIRATGEHQLLVMKFGGTSVGDAECISRVAQRISEHAREANMTVVVSAMAGVTESLIRGAHAAGNGDREQWKNIARGLTRGHQEVANQLLSGSELTGVWPLLAEQVQIFENLCSGFSLVGEVTPRALDTVSSLGEMMSANLLAAVLRSKGHRAEAIDAMELIVTDDNFGNASPLFDETNARLCRRLKPLLQSGSIPVVPGFRGATRGGACTTLGRGASDYTATIVGSALDADEVWIWTDVDGVMTADPRLVPGARIIPEISYRETIELSFFGAKVLHAKAVQPAMKKGITVLIRNTFSPSCLGTRIGPNAVGQPGVRAITAVSNASLFSVVGNDSLSFGHLAAKIFGALAPEEIPTLMATQSSAENVLCFAIHAAEEPRVRARLEKAFTLEMRHDYVAAIDIMPKVGIVVAVGEKMKGTPGIAGRMFGALGRRGINVIAIAQGSSELSVSLAVQSGEVAEAVRTIHGEFQL